MNTILQKRIEEAADAYSQGKPYSYEQGFLQGCEWLLKNQWIYVEEALPEMTDEDMEWSDIVIIKCKYCEDMKPCIMTSRYDVGTGFWLNPVAREITHWMPVPSLEGGEE